MADRGEDSASGDNSKRVAATILSAACRGYTQTYLYMRQIELWLYKLYKGNENKVEERSPPKKARLSTDRDDTPNKEEAFPSTLEGFSYHFNTDGQLRHKETEEPFQFMVRENDIKYNQRRYEALGEVITEHVYSLLESPPLNLKRIPVPVNASDDEPRSFIFASKDKFSNPDKVLVLIHGDGVVRAGQWARRLIINDCLDSGTQIPYIKRAQKLGYEILVLNSNLNRAVRKDGKEKPVRDNSSPQKHVLYVWNEFLVDVPEESVAIVAHSFGGVCTLNLAMKKKDFFKKVFFVAFTDSVHSMALQDASSEAQTWFAKNSVNWVKSDKPLGTSIAATGSDSPRISAGTKKHEETSWMAIDKVFENLEKRQKKGRESEEKTEL